MIEDDLPERRLLEKAATIKRFEYSALRKAFQKQTNFIQKQIEVIEKKKFQKKEALENNNWDRSKIP